MDINAIRDKLIQIVNSNALVILFFIFIIALTIKSKTQKNKKIKILSADDRFKYAKFFTSEIKSPLAISSTGCIGVTLDNVPAPLIIYIKDIKRIILSINNLILIDRDGDSSGNFLFSGVALKVASTLQQKLKKVTLILYDNNDSVLNIPLFVSTLTRAIILSDSKQGAIKQLLQTLEEVERNVKN